MTSKRSIVSPIPCLGTLTESSITFALVSSSSSCLRALNLDPRPESPEDSVGIPSSRESCRIFCEPTLEVMIINVLVKSIVRPLLSVRRPSSSIWRSTLKTSGCAFSISSNKTKEYGFRLTASVSCPPSSKPTYPGGDPTRREVANLSIYSDISSRIMASSEPKYDDARDLASSVFPTPVGPAKIKLATGRLASLRPTRDLLIALAMETTGCFWPITRSESSISRFINFFLSSWSTAVTGIPVHVETTCAICSFDTSGTSPEAIGSA
mmetsp:Transcript_33499/g.53883  ORF Transcript_33499/g.53883 Transcript_33499/m.53883 type:complete len:267 (-) Transcript_33499:1660-2460(-)